MILIENGIVIDPANGLEGEFDVLIDSGMVKDVQARVGGDGVCAVPQNGRDDLTATGNADAKPRSTVRGMDRWSQHYGRARLPPSRTLPCARNDRLGRSLALLCPI